MLNRIEGALLQYFLILPIPLLSEIRIREYSLEQECEVDVADVAEAEDRRPVHVEVPAMPRSIQLL